jgi:hypothetical protein
LRPYQIATAAGFMILAAVAMFDSRAGALVDTSGTEPGGIGAGFYPFWSAAVIFVCAVIVAIGAGRSAEKGPPAFEGREAVVAVLKIVGPMVLGSVAIIWLGFYIVSALYMALFARWVGHYRWFWVLALAIGLPVAIYAAFELGFRVSLPKSFLYDQGILPF